MAQVCEITGRRPAYGNKVSHSNIKTRIRWMPNLRDKRYEIPELKQTISIRISSRAIRTIDKLGGITQTLMAARMEDLSTRMQQVRNQIYRSRVKATAAGKVAAAAGVKKVKKAKAPKEAAAPKAAAPAASSKAAKAKKAPKAAKAKK